MPDVSACPPNPAPPAGYIVWKGRVPDPLVAWAKGLRDHIAKYPLHTVWWSDPDIWPDLVAARSDSHTWTFVPGRGLVTGICIRGITLYRPMPQGVRGADYVLDPALAAPDPALALFADAPVVPTNWGLVAVSAVAILAVAAAFAAAISHAGARPRARRLRP